jgi:hypothetical protein
MGGSCGIAGQVVSCELGSLDVAPATIILDITYDVTGSAVIGTGYNVEAQIGCDEAINTDNDKETALTTVVACNKKRGVFDTSKFPTTPLIGKAAVHHVEARTNPVLKTLAKKKEWTPAKRLGKALKPKLIDVRVKALANSRSFEVTVVNSQKRRITLEDLSVSVTMNNGKIESSTLVKDSPLVASTSCRQVQGRDLQARWASVCDVTLAELKDAKSFKFSARGVMQLSKGFHPTMGSKMVEAQKK